MAKQNKQNTLRIISNNIYMLRFVAKFTPGLIVWTILSSILSGMVGILNTVYIAKYVLDGLQNNISFSQMLPFLSGALLLNLILALLNGLYSGWYFPSMKERLYGKMHEELFMRAKEMELACYDNPKFYNDFVWAMSQADEKALTVLDSVGRFLKFFSMASGAAAIIASINTIGLYVAVFGLAVEWFFGIKNNKMYYELADVQKPLQRKRDYTSRILYQPDYAKEVRLSEVKDILIEDFSTTNKSLVKVIKKYGKKMTALTSMYVFLIDNLLYNGFYIGYLLYGMLDKHIFEYGRFYALYSGTYQFSENWSNMVYFFTRLQNDSLYIEKFRTFLEYEPKMKLSKDGLTAPKNSCDISLENVSFTYEGMEKPTLNNINLTIHTGEKIALVGYNGAGKSTLIKLIMRLYDVTEGKIYLDEKDIRDYILDEYRKYFGVVFQDYQLFAATISENVMMDKVLENDEKQIKDALEKSGFRAKLEELPFGTKTILSREFDKNGVNLSGGEGQKVAIARIFPRDCKAVILDEPSSALDPVSEYNVNKSMLAAAKDKTVIFISHRLSTTMLADRIYMLENGQIIEQGSHKELMNLNGKYAEMFNIQAEKYSAGGEW